MAEINDVQLRDFCNSDLRIIADLLTRLDVRATGAIETYNARNLGSIIDSAGAGNLIADGSETDGRTRCVGGDVYNFVTLMTELEAFFAANSRRDVVGKWQVNGNR